MGSCSRKSGVISGPFSLKLNGILFKQKWGKSGVSLVHFRPNQISLRSRKKIILVHTSLFLLTQILSLKLKKRKIFYFDSESLGYYCLLFLSGNYTFYLKV